MFPSTKNYIRSIRKLTTGCIAPLFFPCSVVNRDGSALRPSVGFVHQAVLSTRAPGLAGAQRATFRRASTAGERQIQSTLEAAFFFFFFKGSPVSMFFVLRLMVVTFFLYRQAPTAGETLGVFFFFNVLRLNFWLFKHWIVRYNSLNVILFYFFSAISFHLF